MNNQILRNNIMRKYIDYGSRMHINCIRFDGNGNPEHENKVIEICMFLRKNKIDFICRPIINIGFAHREGWSSPKLFNNIPDILAFTEIKPTVIEILNTESKDHAENKSYPEEFKLIPIHVTDKIDVLEGMV